MARDLFVTTNAKRADGVSSFRKDGLLPGELLEHFRGFGETIARFPDRDVQDELVDADFFHRVRLLSINAGE